MSLSSLLSGSLCSIEDTFNLTAKLKGNLIIGMLATISRTIAAGDLDIYAMYGRNICNNAYTLPHHYNVARYSARLPVKRYLYK